MLSEEQLSKLAEQTPRAKIRYETYNNDFNEIVYENYLRCQTHINNFKKVNVEWRRCETCNGELGAQFGRDM